MPALSRKRWSYQVPGFLKRDRVSRLRVAVAGPVTGTDPHYPHIGRLGGPRRGLSGAVADHGGAETSAGTSTLLSSSTTAVDRWAVPPARARPPRAPWRGGGRRGRASGSGRGRGRRGGCSLCQGGTGRTPPRGRAEIHRGQYYARNGGDAFLRDRQRGRLLGSARGRVPSLP